MLRLPRGTGPFREIVIGGFSLADYHFIGRSIPRVDAREKVTGEAVYSSDIQLPGMLVGKCKRSPYPFARILSIDSQKARRLCGVHAVITAQDITQFPYGEYADDQLPLCDQYAHYAGDEVAAVAAVNAEAPFPFKIPVRVAAPEPPEATGSAVVRVSELRCVIASTTLVALL